MAKLGVHSLSPSWASASDANSAVDSASPRSWARWLQQSAISAGTFTGILGGPRQQRARTLSAAPSGIPRSATV